jgi:hypothetical protein
MDQIKIPLRTACGFIEIRSPKFVHADSSVYSDHFVVVECHVGCECGLYPGTSHIDLRLRYGRNLSTARSNQLCLLCGAP